MYGQPSTKRWGAWDLEKDPNNCGSLNCSYHYSEVNEQFTEFGRTARLVSSTPNIITGIYYSAIDPILFGFTLNVPVAGGSVRLLTIFKCWPILKSCAGRTISATPYGTFVGPCKWSRMLQKWRGRPGVSKTHVEKSIRTSDGRFRPEWISIIFKIAHPTLSWPRLQSQVWPSWMRLKSHYTTCMGSLQPKDGGRET